MLYNAQSRVIELFHGYSIIVSEAKYKAIDWEGTKY